jgi:hypothetical protein
MPDSPPPGDLSFSLVRDDAWYRLQRVLRLVPADGKDGIFRRILFFIVLAWLPLVAWALATGRAFECATGEPLLRHYGTHARYLVALPALIFGERVAQSVMKRLLPRFVSSGCVPEEKIPAFRGIIASMIRLRNSTLPWIGIAGVILLWIFVPDTGLRLEELDWARTDGGLGFGGWWFLLVSRPVFQIFLFAWLWRVLLFGVLLKRVAGLGLDLVPNHPDRLGGLGFVPGFPVLFAPFAFALSCILASKWAHDIVWHGAHVRDFKLLAGLFVAVLLLVCLSPLTVFMPLLKRTRRKALADYGNLIARHGRLVHREWIEGRPVADRALLEAPELGPACDIGAIHDSVVAMRNIPLTKASVLVLVLPAAVPLLIGATIEIPIVELLGKLFKTLL